MSVIDLVKHNVGLNLGFKIADTANSTLHKIPASIKLTGMSSNGSPKFSIGVGKNIGGINFSANMSLGGFFKR